MHEHQLLLHLVQFDEVSMSDDLSTGHIESMLRGALTASSSHRLPQSHLQEETQNFEHAFAAETVLALQRSGKVQH